jgi:hypothetical protein
MAITIEIHLEDVPRTPKGLLCLVITSLFLFYWPTPEILMGPQPALPLWVKNRTF